MPPIPNTPEPLATLQARYPRCLDHTYDQAAIRDRGGIRPGEVAANVFDFESDGLRLIISRERSPDGIVTLHFSASFPGECRIADEFRLLKLTMPVERIMRKWIDSIPARFRELSGDQRPILFIGRSDVGIPHWVIEEAPEQ